MTFHQLPVNESPSAWGGFGDYLGGLLNPLVSTFTLFFAVKVWMQQKIELSATKSALEDQAKTAEANRREQRFFDLMRMYQQTLDGFQEVPDPRNGIAKSGKPAIDHWFISVHSMNCIAHSSSLGKAQKLTKEQLEAINVQWSNAELSGKFNHYFRVLFRILRDAEDLLGEEKYRFIRIFRAQLSQSELFLVGLNLSLSKEGQKMLPVVEAYGLLKHLPEGTLRQKLEHELPPAVFGRHFAKTKHVPHGERPPC